MSIPVHKHIHVYECITRLTCFDCLCHSNRVNPGTRNGKDIKSNLIYNALILNNMQNTHDNNSSDIKEYQMWFNHRHIIVIICLWMQSLNRKTWNRITHLALFSPMDSHVNWLVHSKIFWNGPISNEYCIFRSNYVGYPCNMLTIEFPKKPTWGLHNQRAFWI